MSLVVFARLVFPELSLLGRGARRSAGHGRRKGHFSVASFSFGCSGLRLFSHHCVSSFLALVPVSSALAVGGSLVVIGDLDLAEHTIGRNGDFIEATFKAQRFLESNPENVGGGVPLSVGQGTLLSKLFEFSSKVVNVVHLGHRIIRVLCLSVRGPPNRFAAGGRQAFREPGWVVLDLDRRQQYLEGCGVIFLEESPALGEERV